MADPRAKGLALLEELKTEVTAVLALAAQAPAASSPPFAITDDVIAAHKLLYSVEKVLTFGLKDIAFIGTTVFWDYLQNLTESMPDSEKLVREVKQMGRSDLSRGRMFLRYALNQRSLHTYLEALSWNRALTVKFYAPLAILAVEELSSAFTMLLQSLKDTSFRLSLQERGQGNGNYWEQIFTLLAQRFPAQFEHAASHGPNSNPQSPARAVSAPQMQAVTPPSAGPAKASPASSPTTAALSSSPMPPSSPTTHISAVSNPVLPLASRQRSAPPPPEPSRPEPPPTHIAPQQPPPPTAQSEIKSSGPVDSASVRPGEPEPVLVVAHKKTRKPRKKNVVTFDSPHGGVPTPVEDSPAAAMTSATESGGLGPVETAAPRETEPGPQIAQNVAQVVGGTQEESRGGQEETKSAVLEAKEEPWSTDDLRADKDADSPATTTPVDQQIVSDAGTPTIHKEVEIEQEKPTREPSAPVEVPQPRPIGPTPRISSPKQTEDVTQVDIAPEIGRDKPVEGEEPSTSANTPAPPVSATAEPPSEVSNTSPTKRVPPSSSPLPEVTVTPAMPSGFSTPKKASPLVLDGSTPVVELSDDEAFLGSSLDAPDSDLTESGSIDGIIIPSAQAFRAPTVDLPPLPSTLTVESLDQVKELLQKYAIDEVHSELVKDLVREVEDLSQTVGLEARVYLPQALDLLLQIEKVLSHKIRPLSDETSEDPAGAMWAWFSRLGEVLPARIGESAVTTIESGPLTTSQGMARAFVHLALHRKDLSIDLQALAWLPSLEELFEEGAIVRNEALVAMVVAVLTELESRFDWAELPVQNPALDTPHFYAARKHAIEGTLPDVDLFKAQALPEEPAATPAPSDPEVPIPKATSTGEGLKPSKSRGSLGGKKRKAKKRIIRHFDPFSPTPKRASDDASDAVVAPEEEKSPVAVEPEADLTKGGLLAGPPPAQPTAASVAQNTVDEVEHRLEPSRRPSSPVPIEPASSSSPPERPSPVEASPVAEPAALVTAPSVVAEQKRLDPFPASPPKEVTPAARPVRSESQALRTWGGGAEEPVSSPPKTSNAMSTSAARPHKQPDPADLEAELRASRLYVGPTAQPRSSSPRFATAPIHSLAMQIATSSPTGNSPPALSSTAAAPAPTPSYSTFTASNLPGRMPTRLPRGYNTQTFTSQGLPSLPAPTPVAAAPPSISAPEPVAPSATAPVTVPSAPIPAPKPAASSPSSTSSSPSGSWTLLPPLAAIVNALTGHGSDSSDAPKGNDSRGVSSASVAAALAAGRARGGPLLGEVELPATVLMHPVIPNYDPEPSRRVVKIKSRGFHNEMVSIKEPELEVEVHSDELKQVTPHRILQLEDLPRRPFTSKTKFCAGCGAELTKTLVATPRYCYYTHGYYCNTCHNNDSSILPAKVVTAFDFRSYHVCVFAKTEIDANYKKPVISLGSLNAKIKDWIPGIARIQKMRPKLVSVGEYIRTCRHSGKLLSRLDGHMHLILSPDMFSLFDLALINKGNDLEKLLRQVFEEYVAHIVHCEICKGKAFICEVCHADELIYPFQDRIVNCNKCNSVFHEACFPSPATATKKKGLADKRNSLDDLQVECPKCKRIAALQAAGTLSTPAKR